MPSLWLLSLELSTCVLLCEDCRLLTRTRRELRELLHGGDFTKLAKRSLITSLHAPASAACANPTELLIERSVRGSPNLSPHSAPQPLRDSDTEMRSVYDRGDRVACHRSAHEVCRHRSVYSRQVKCWSNYPISILSFPSLLFATPAPIILFIPLLFLLVATSIFPFSVGQKRCI